MFAGPEETRSRLERAGFDRIECWLHDEPTPIPQGDLELYLRTICLGSVVGRIPEEERDDVLRLAAERLPERRDRLRPPQHPRTASTAGSASGPPR